jgi:hypothetical protein
MSNFQQQRKLEWVKVELWNTLQATLMGNSLTARAIALFPAISLNTKPPHFQFPGLLWMWSSWRQTIYSPVRCADCHLTSPWLDSERNCAAFCRSKAGLWGPHKNTKHLIPQQGWGRTPASPVCTLPGGVGFNFLFFLLWDSHCT